MMNKRNGFTIVEVLFAFLILILAISITVTGAAWVVTLEKKAVVKSDIYDVAYSYAEEILGTEYGSLGDLDDEVELNGFAYKREYIPSTDSDFLKWKVDYVTLTVTLEDENNQFDGEEYSVEMTVIPKQ